MKRLLRISAVLSLILLIGIATGAVNLLFNTALFYVKVARLYAADPPAKISMPVAGVTRRQVANTWQAPRGSGRRHEGQDIFAKRGTPVYSATRGYVYNIGENNLGGQTVSVIGAGGRVYYYAHLDSYAAGLAEGDYVTPQTKLGEVGTTGNAQGTPPHLHFGVYTPSGAIDPLPLLGSPKSQVPSPKSQVRSQSLKLDRPIKKREAQPRAIQIERPAARRA